MASSKKHLTHTKLIDWAVILEDIVVTIVVLILAWRAVDAGFLGSLPYLSSIIVAEQAKVSIIINRTVKKATVENSKDGIVYETALKSYQGEDGV